MGDQTASTRCQYPGCTRPSRPNPATGRPTLFCDQSDPGGPVHNRTTAWQARRATVVATDRAAEKTVSTPVSMARATVEQRVAGLPDLLVDFRAYLDASIASIREAGDIEAAGVEVEDAHREALAMTTEAERRANIAERAGRQAEERAAHAELKRQEAEAVTDGVLAEAAEDRARLTAEARRVREEADAAITAMRDQLSAALADHTRELAERDAALVAAQAASDTAHLEAVAAAAAKVAAEEALARELQNTAQLRAQLDAQRLQADEARQRLENKLDANERLRQQAADDLTAMHIDLASSHAETEAARQTVQHERDLHETTRRELATVRADVQAERETLRTVHAEQIAQLQRSSDQRVEALTQALQALQATSAARRAKRPPKSLSE